MSVERVSLVADISRRLFTAIGLLLFTLVVLGLVGGRLWPAFTEGRVLSPALPVSSAASGTPGSSIAEPLRGPPMVLVVIGLGALGGFVGLQRRLKKLPAEDLRLLAASWLYALLSPLVGGVLALVLYALFMSGLLAGDLFPRLCPDASVLKEDTYRKLLECAPESVAAYAKLFFWSFVGGFSERFVVDIIGRFEHQAHEQHELAGPAAPPPSP